MDLECLSTSGRFFSVPHPAALAAIELNLNDSLSTPTRSNDIIQIGWIENVESWNQLN